MTIPDILLPDLQLKSLESKIKELFLKKYSGYTKHQASFKARDVTDALSKIAWTYGEKKPKQQKFISWMREWLETGLFADDVLCPLDRFDMGDTLAMIGDTRPGVGVIKTTHGLRLPDIQWCYVPLGPFWMGSVQRDNEKPQHLNRHLNYGYWIAKFPITVEQFRAFTSQERFVPGNNKSLKGIANHPVNYVNWHEANAFCKWLNEIIQKGLLKLGFRSLKKAKKIFLPFHNGIITGCDQLESRITS